MHSTRFGLPVVLTEHARLRMAKRAISEALLLDIIDTGTARDAGRGHYWLYMEVLGRSDNLLCAAVVMDNAVVVKTVMHHWETRP